jgi:hypothetical protein
MGQKKKSKFFIMIQPSPEKDQKMGPKKIKLAQKSAQMQKSPKKPNFSKGGYSGAVLSFITANRRL